MNARITIDGENVLTVNSKGLPMDDMRDALRKIAVTQNPVAKTAVSGIKFFANAEMAIEKIATLGKADSFVEFYELPEGKKEERLAARYTLGNFVARMKVTANAESVMGEIIADESTKKTATGKTEQASDF